MAVSLDRRSVLEGAAVALVVTLPPVILVRILYGDDMPGEESNAWIVPMLALFAGFILGGHRAAKRQPREAFAHAAAATALAFAIVVAYSVVRRTVTGDDIGLSFFIRMALLGSITVSLGVLGGYVAVRKASSP